MALEDDADFSDNAIRSSVDAMERMLREALVFGGPVQGDEGWLLRSRRTVARAVTSFTAYAILSLLVILNTVAMALFDPQSPGSPGNTTIFYVCAAVNAVFSLDAVLKIFAFGITGKGGYFSDGWNLADVALIVIGWAAFAPGTINLSGLRCLRILGWLYAAVPGARLVLIACYKSLPGLGGVFVLSMLTYSVFALVAIELWPGVIGGSCTATPLSPADTLVVSKSYCSITCASFSGRCSPSFGDLCSDAIDFAPNGSVSYVPSTCALRSPLGAGTPNFDNFGSALLLAFVLPTTEGWSDVMYSLWHSWGYQPVVSMLLVAHVLLGAWFILELNFAVVTGEYDAAAELEDDRGPLLREIMQLLHSLRLSEAELYEQRVVMEEQTSLARMALDVARATSLLELDDALLLWQAFKVEREQLRVQNPVTDAATPRPEDDVPPSPVVALQGYLTVHDGVICSRCGACSERMQKRALALASSSAFKVFAMVVIVANAILLCFERYNPDQQLKLALAVGNYALTSLFAAEMVVRLCAYGREFWCGPNFRLNWIEAFILLISVIDVIGQVTGRSAMHASLYSLRVVRAIRALQVVRIATPWMEVFSSILEATFPALNALSILVVFLVSMALVGMQAFGGGNIKPAVGNAWLNFDSFWWAFVTVYDVADNENWNDTLYAHLSAFGPGSAIFFIVIVCAGNYLFLNILLAILVRGFENARSDSDSASLTSDVKRSYQSFKAWVQSAGGPAEPPLDGKDPVPTASSVKTFPALIRKMTTDTGLLSTENRRVRSVSQNEVPVTRRWHSLNADHRADATATRRWHSLTSDHRAEAQVTSSAGQSPAREVARPRRQSAVRRDASFRRASAPVVPHHQLAVPFAVNGRRGRTRRRSLDVAQPPDEDVERPRRVSSTMHAHEGLKARHVRNSVESVSSVFGASATPMLVSHRVPRRSLAIASGIPPFASEESGPMEQGRQGISSHELAGIIGARTESSERSEDDGEVSRVVVLLEAHAASSAIQRIHAFVPESPAVIIDQDDDVAVAVDDVNDVPIDPSLAGLQISVSITGDIDIRHVSEPSTLHADRGKDPSAARLVGSRQQDVTSALQVVESRSVTTPPASVCIIDPGESVAPDTNRGPRSTAAGSSHRAVLHLLDAARLRWARLRLHCALFVTHGAYDFVMLVVIVYSCACMTVDSGQLAACVANGSASCRAWAQFVAVSDATTTIIFVIDVVLCVMARGAWALPFNSDAYFASGWRTFDAAIVVTCVASSFSVAHSRALRATRALRAMRLIVRMPNLKLVASALVTAMPRMRHVLVVVFLFIFCFAVIGVLSFGGAMARCTDNSITTASECVGSFFPTADVCGYQPTPADESACRLSVNGTAFPRLWKVFSTSTHYAGESFDDVGHSILVVLELVTGENWPVIMFNAINGDSASGHHVGTVIPYENPAGALFFVLSQLILNSFLVDLFTGMIIDQYRRMCDAARGLRDPLNTSKVIISAAQQTWVSNARTIMAMRPSRQLRFRSALQIACFNIVTSPWFDWAIAGVVLTNTVFMAIRHANEDVIYDYVLQVSNAVFIGLAFVEISLKVAGLGFRQVIRSGWNCFDILVLVGSIVTAALNLGSVGLLLRSFRIFRLFRIVRVSSTLTHLANTFYFVLGPFLNILLVLALTIFIYAVAGMYLFAGIRQSNQYYLNEDTNFEDFGTAFITLIRCTTGENWNGIMYSLAIAPPFCDDTVARNCGWPLFVPAIYFVSFFFLTSVTFVGLLTAVILKAFEDSKLRATGTQGRVHSLTLAEAEAYTNIWSSIDVTSSWWLSENAVVNVIARLPWPLGTMEDLQTSDLSISLRRKASMKFLNASSGKIPNSETKALARERLRQLPLQPDAFGRLHFHAVLLALVEQASTVPPLGDPTHAVVVDRPSKPPFMRWTPQWCQWQSATAVDEAARAADTARFTSAMAPRKELTVATQTSVATRMSHTGLGETVVDLTTSPRSPGRPLAGSLMVVSPRELAMRELVALDSGHSIGLEREELGVVPEEDALPSPHSPGDPGADHARRTSGFDGMDHPPDVRAVESHLFRLIQHVRSQVGARQHSTRSTLRSDSGRLAGMGPSRLASDEISLHSNSVRLREAGGPPVSQTTGLSTNSGRLREAGGPPVSQTSGLSTNSGRLREAGGPLVSRTTGLRTRSGRRGGRSLLGVPPPQLQQRPAERQRDENARDAPGVRSLAGPSDGARISRRRPSAEATEREHGSRPHITAPQRPTASPVGPANRAPPLSPPLFARADSLGGLSADGVPSESSHTGEPLERVGSAEGSGATSGASPPARAAGGGVSLREAFQQRKATMATISTRFLARQRSLRMLPSPPPERQARHPESPSAAGDSFEPPRGQAWAAPLPLERGSSLRHSPSKRFTKQASGLLPPPALDMAGGGGGRAAATVVRALSSSPPSPLIAPGGVRSSDHPSKAAISVRSLLTPPGHAAGRSSDAAHAAISARPELLPPPRGAAGGAAAAPSSTESVALGTVRAPEPAMVSARARAALARVLAEDRDRGAQERAEPLASAPEAGAPEAARSGTLPGGVPRRSSSE